MGAMARRPVTARPLILRQSKSAAPTSCKPRLQAAERAPRLSRSPLPVVMISVSSTSEISPQSSPVSLSRSAEMIISANRPPRKPRAVCAASAGNHGLAYAPFFAFFLDNLQFDRYNNPSPAEQAGGLYIKLSFCGSDASDPLFFCIFSCTEAPGARDASVCTPGAVCIRFSPLPQTQRGFSNAPELHRPRPVQSRRTAW